MHLEFPSGYLLYKVLYMRIRKYNKQLLYILVVIWLPKVGTINMVLDVQ